MAKQGASSKVTDIVHSLATATRAKSVRNPLALGSVAVEKKFKDWATPRVWMLRLKFQVQHLEPAGHRMLRWTDNHPLRTHRRTGAEQARRDHEDGESQLPAFGVERHWPSP